MLCFRVPMKGTVNLKRPLDWLRKKRNKETCNLDSSCNVLANGRASVSPPTRKEMTLFLFDKTQSFLFFYFKEVKKPGVMK